MLPLICHLFSDGHSRLADPTLHGDLVLDLEFMSTGFGYDMILLSIKGPGGACVMPTRSKAPRRPHHHASPPKRRRAQHRHRPTATTRSSPREGQATMEGPTTPHAKTTVMMARRPSHRMTALGRSIPCAPSPPSTLLPHGLFAARWMLPFDLDNIATSLSRTICPGVGTCVEWPLVLPHDTETQQRTQQVAEESGFPQIRKARCL